MRKHNAPSGKGTQENKPLEFTRKTIRPSTDEPLIIDDYQTHETLKRIPNHNTQYCALVKKVIKNGEVLTGRANPFAGVNISSCARESINPRIEDLGIELHCRFPKEEIKTVHGNHSGQVYWGFFPL